MKVSLVIPAHNEEKHIKAVLQSALNQTYHNFEIILVDNASSDKTSEVAKKYIESIDNEKRKITVKIISENRKGTQWARERGRKESTGEIIANLDADCLPKSDWIEKGTHAFLVKNVVAVGGPYYYYDASNFFRKFSLFFQKTIYFWTNNIFQKLGRGAVLIGGNLFLRASALEKAGGYNTSLVFYGDDTDTAKRMAIQGRVVFDKNLIMPTSARRLKSQGSLKTSIIYMYHFVKVILKK